MVWLQLLLNLLLTRLVKEKKAISLNVQLCKPVFTVRWETGELHLGNLVEQDKNPILNKPLSWYDESGHENDNYSLSFVSEHLSISCTESVVNFTSSGIPFGWDSVLGFWNWKTRITERVFAGGNGGAQNDYECCTVSTVVVVGILKVQTQI